MNDDLIIALGIPMLIGGIIAFERGYTLGIAAVLLALVLLARSAWNDYQSLYG